MIYDLFATSRRSITSWQFYSTGYHKLEREDQFFVAGNGRFAIFEQASESIDSANLTEIGQIQFHNFSIRNVIKSACA